MLDRGHHLVFRGTVARQLVRDHHTRGPHLPLQKLAQQALGGPLVPPALDQNVEHDPILVDRPPEPVLLAADHQAHFVQVPLVSRVWQLAADLVGKALAELARPLPHGFMAHVDAAGRQHLFHHAQAEREPEVQPHGVADDLARKAVEPILTKYTRDGQNLSPPLYWTGAPADTRSYVVIVEDPGCALRHFSALGYVQHPS